MTQCAPGSRKIILAVACYAMAAFNSVALLGALTGPIAFGMTADFVGLRWALAATTVVPLAWMSSLALRVRSGIRGGG